MDSARKSLETSLRELKTDYIDIYLLHECELIDCRPELLQFLEDASRAGKSEHSVSEPIALGPRQYVNQNQISLPSFNLKAAYWCRTLRMWQSQTIACREVFGAESHMARWPRFDHCASAFGRTRILLSGFRWQPVLSMQIQYR